MKLLKYDSNWADEMDIEGFTIMTNEDWEKWKTDIRKFFKKRKRGWSYGVGTNEEIDYSSAEDVLNDIKVTDISKDDAETINRLFFTGSACVAYGFFPCFYDYDYDGDLNDESEDE